VPSDGTTFLAGERLWGMLTEPLDSESTLQAASRPEGTSLPRQPRRRRIALGAPTTVTAFGLGASSSGGDARQCPVR
jgi:hypothetical protein